MLSSAKSALMVIFNWRRRQSARVQRETERSSPIGLCELPVELLTMILEDLDWTDVLRVRETCKKLQEISKARSIWLNLCRPHLTATATAPQILHLERPIHLHTSSELEYHFLRLKSASIGWETDDFSPSRRREIVTTSNSSCMYMVEGGRWFLVASDMGSISYFDLEASDPTENILTPEQFQTKSATQVTMAIDFDSESTFLAFNLVVSYCSMIPEPKEHKIQFWRVSLTLDDQQRGVGLSAKRLAAFPQELSINRIRSISLRGPHLALSVYCSHYVENLRTFVIDWKRADGDSTDYPRRLLHPSYGPKNIHLLPGNRLIAVSKEAIMIFDYSAVEETTSMPPFNHSGITATPVWAKRGLHLPDRPATSSFFCSRPFFCSTSIRLSFRDDRYLYGLIIDHPSDESLAEGVHVVKIMDFPPIDEYQADAIYAYNRATIVDYQHNTYLLSYSWPDEENHEPEPTWLHKDYTFMNCIFGPFMDAESGRVIVSGNQYFIDEDSTGEDSAGEDSDRENLVNWDRDPEPGVNAKFCHDVWDFALLYQ